MKLEMQTLVILVKCVDLWKCALASESTENVDNNETTWMRHNKHLIKYLRNMNNIIHLGC